MNPADTTLVLLLAARIHGTDEAVKASAKSVVKKLRRSKGFFSRSMNDICART
ncbi:MAG: hypothetical protein ACNJA3_12410 [Pseudomonas rhizophila]